MENNKLFQFLTDRIKNPSSITLSLPEKDKRIDQSVEILRDTGLNIITNKAITDRNSPSYSLEYIDKTIQDLKFIENWPDADVHTFFRKTYSQSLAMLKNNDVDGVVCGCTMSSSVIIRNAIRIIGIHESSKWITSMFLMVDPETNRFLTFADCAVIPEPSSEQLAEIASKSGNMHRNITEEEPKVAFLSFSTKGSAEHYRVSNVRKAIEIFTKKTPHISHEGELQLDAAINEKISKIKVNNSELKGKANTLIFPNLDAGNIGYKLTQQLAGYYACGPLLLGLKKPVNDLSRGATVNDIVLISLITAIQAQG